MTDLATMPAPRPLLADALDVAVPMALHRLAELPAADRAEAIARYAADAVDLLASSGDTLLCATRPSPATARHVAEPGTRNTFAALARGLAAGAHMPGGITWLGRHWCTNHTRCEAAAAEAAERARRDAA